MAVSCVAEKCSKTLKLKNDNREIRVLANAKRHDPLPKENHFFFMFHFI